MLVQIKVVQACRPTLISWVCVKMPKIGFECSNVCSRTIAQLYVSSILANNWELENAGKLLHAEKELLDKLPKGPHLQREPQIVQSAEKLHCSGGGTWEYPLCVPMSAGFTDWHPWLSICPGNPCIFCVYKSSRTGIQKTVAYYLHPYANGYHMISSSQTDGKDYGKPWSHSMVMLQVMTR